MRSTNPVPGTLHMSSLDTESGGAKIWGHVDCCLEGEDKAA